MALNKKTHHAFSGRVPNVSSVRRGNLTGPQERTRNVGLWSVYRAAGSAHSVAHKALLHSLPARELTHLIAFCQRTTQRPHTGTPIDSPARTHTRRRSARRKLGRGRSCSQDDTLGKLHLFFSITAGTMCEGCCVLVHIIIVVVSARTQSRTLTRALMMIRLLFSSSV